MPAPTPAGARPTFKISLPATGIADKDFGSTLVDVNFADGRRYQVTFRTLGNIERLFNENRRTGVRAKGTYMPGAHTILVEEITKPGIHTAIRELLETGEFNDVCALAGGLTLDDEDELTDPRGVRPGATQLPAQDEQMWRQATLTTFTPSGGQTDQPQRLSRDDVNALVEKHINDWSSTLAITGRDQTLTLCFSEGKVGVVMKAEDGRNFIWLSLKDSRASVWFALAGQLTELPERHIVGEFDAISLAEEFVAEWHLTIADHEWEFRPLPPPRKSRRS